MKKIQILLSTYNGEKYLEQQLESYIALDNFQDVGVIIRDDGSHDGTCEILRRYSEKHGFTVIYGDNIGLNKSLHELIKHRDREYEYFAFSDQDDFWLPEKLSRAVNMLDGARDGAPTLYAALSYITDDNLEKKGVTLNPTKEISFYNSMVQNVCIGHTQVFDNAMAELLEMHFSESMYLMDYWAYMTASCFGKIVFDSVPTTLYRQHSSNAVGYDSSKIKTAFRRVKRALTTRDAEAKIRHLEAFKSEFAENLDAQYLEAADDFLNSRKNFFTRLSYIFRTPARRQSLFENIVFRMMYLFGKYNYKNKDRDK